MPTKNKKSDAIKDALKITVSAVVVGGKFLAWQVKDLYNKFDPDVARHLLQLPLLSYSLLTSKTQKIEPLEPDGYFPLVFVHGLGGNRGNFLPMSWYMWLMGRKRSYRVQFNPNHSMEQMAEALARFIRELKKVTGEKKVEIVAHSMGGLIARMAITGHRLGSSVNTLITLGAPHQGTYSARYAGTKLTRGLRPDSELIKKINRGKIPSGIRVVTFWSRNDLMIIPPESAVLEGAEQVDASPFTHLSYLIDPKSWSSVHRALEK
ncbi:MAG: alpha/beta hydrolase [bacterium]|nr:alpha/beta hydrolase [bacterium]